MKQLEKHIQKKISAHLLPLAIPKKDRRLDITKIPVPVIKNPTPLVKNKMEISLRNDTLKFKGDFKRLASTKWLVDLEKAEKDVRKYLAVFEKNAQLKQPYDKEKVIHDMQVALSQLKATKLKLQKNSPTACRPSIRNSNSYSQVLSSTEAKRWEQEEDLKALAEEMIKEWVEVQQHYLHLTRTDENIHSNIQIPAVVYTTPTAHSFSFEFSEKPQVQVLRRAATSSNTNACSEVGKKARTLKNVPRDCDIEEEVISSFPLAAPPQPIKKAVNRTKRMTIIHI